MKVRIRRKDGVVQRYRILRKSLKNDYGNNYYANRELKDGLNLKKNDIVVDKKIKGRLLRQTIAHEKIEAYLMGIKHMPYKKADRIATKFDMNVR